MNLGAIKSKLSTASFGQLWAIAFFGVCLSYFPFFFFGFVWDDRVVIESNQLLRNWGGIFEFFRGHIDHNHIMDGTYRPLFMSFLNSWGHLFSYRAGVYRISTLLFHALNGVFLYKLACREFSLSRQTAMFIAALFLIHPIQSTNIGLIWKQSDVWIALFTLSSIYALPAKPWLSFLLFIGGLLSKESALIIPAFWIVFLLLSQTRKTSSFAIVFLGLLVSVAYYYKLYPALPRLNDESYVDFLGRDYFLTQLRVLPVYFNALFNPSRLTIDRTIWVHRGSIFEYGFFLTISIALLFSLIVWLIRKQSKFAAASLAAILWLTPTSSFIPLPTLYDETRMYLVVAFIGIALALAIKPFANQVTKKIRWFFLGGLLLFLLTTNWLLASRFSSEEQLWRSVLDIDPTCPRAHYHLALSAQNSRALDEAETEYRLTLQNATNLYSARLNLGIVLGQKGDLDGARQQFEELLKLSPMWAATGHYHLGLDAMYRKNPTLALKHFEEATRLYPETGQGYKGKALLLAEQNKTNEAIENWKLYLSSPGLTFEERKVVPKEIQRLLAKTPPLR